MAPDPARGLLTGATLPPSSTPEPNSAVCLSPFSSTTTLPFRIHIYGAFVAAIFYRPGDRRPTAAATLLLAAYGTHAVLNIALAGPALWSPETRILDLDVLVHFRTVLLAFIACARQVLRYQIRGEPCVTPAARRRYEVLKRALGFLLVAVLGGVVVHRRLRVLVSRMPAIGRAECAGLGGVLKELEPGCEGFGVRFHEKADIIAEARYLVPRVIDTIASVATLHAEVAEAAFVYLATLAYRPGLVGNEVTSSADEGVSKAEKGESGASSGDGDGADVRDGWRSWPKPAWGCLINWRSMIFARVCLGAELYYYNASLPEDWGAGWVPYWGVWAVTAVYLAAEAWWEYGGIKGGGVKF